MDIDMENGCESNDSKKGTASVPAAAAAAAAYGLDSDDEKLKFEEDDDLYASDADEADAKWVRKQVGHATAVILVCFQTCKIQRLCFRFRVTVLVRVS